MIQPQIDKINKPVNVVVDCDEVLVDISTKWVYGLLKQSDFFSK